MNEQHLMGQISDHIIQGRFKQKPQGEDKIKTKVLELCRPSMEERVPKPTVLADALDRAMEISLEKYQEGDFLLPEYMIRAEYTGEIRDTLAECSDDISVLGKGRAVLATINGEDFTNWRDNAAMILKAKGFDTINLGDDKSVEQVLKTIKNDTPDILGVSLPIRLMYSEDASIHSTASIPDLEELLEQLSSEGCRDDLTVILGGNIPGSEVIESIGVDYHCNDLPQTIKVFSALPKPSNSALPTRVQ